MPRIFLLLLLTCTLSGWGGTQFSLAQQAETSPSREEVIEPLRKATFNKKKEKPCPERKQEGNPRQVNGCMVFDGSLDGDQQVDPQIAVGKDHILHGTNSGLVIYDKQGNYLQGVRQGCFNDGIDPKLFYDSHNEIFAFDLWNPWDKEKLKPVNVSVSESSDATGAWNTYPIPATKAVDGGAIGHSRKWIGYTFPGGPEQMFVLRTDEAKRGVAATVYHFKGNPGEPVKGQDPDDDLYFLKFTPEEIIISRITEGEDGKPRLMTIAKKKHELNYFDYPPQSPQKDSDKRTSSGDRNPKVLVLQNKHIWFSHTINCEGRAAVQWHQAGLDAGIVQTGLIRHETNNYIQTTIGVNQREDVIIGFQEAGPDMFISPRFAFRRGTDPKGEARPIVSLGEGTGATPGGAWGDYSGSTVDGGNGLDLWTIQSIASDKGNGHTIIAKLPAEEK